MVIWPAGSLTFLKILSVQVARWEYTTRSLTRIFRSPYTACYFLGVVIILLNFLRSHWWVLPLGVFDGPLAKVGGLKASPSNGCVASSPKLVKIEGEFPAHVQKSVWKATEKLRWFNVSWSQLLGLFAGGKELPFLSCQDDCKKFAHDLGFRSEGGNCSAWWSPTLGREVHLRKKHQIAQVKSSKIHIKVKAIVSRTLDSSKKILLSSTFGFD